MQEIEIQGDETVCTALGSYFEKSGMTGILVRADIGISQIRVNAANGSASNVFEKPVRLGEVLDYIERVRHSGANARKQIIEFQNASLDIEMSVFKKQDGQNVSLTEKEVEILILLYETGGEVVSKQDLLKRIWNYVDAVETHTLETHIYRLRQKIEQTPARPAILLTEHNGYKAALGKN